ncbi:MAG: sugar transferase, partial [Patescibacteria group bacterium]
MTKKSELAFTAILVPLDFLLVLAAAAAAHAVRFRILADVRPIVFELPFREYLLLAAGAAAIFIVFFALSGLYSVSGPRRLRIEISRIFLACSTATMTLIMIFFFNRELFSSRFIVLAFWFFAFVYVGAGRVGIRLLQRLMLRFDIGVRRLVLVGADDRTTKTLIAAFAGNPTIGYRVVKRVERFDDAAEADVKKAVETDGVDEIFIANPEIGREELARALGFAEAHHLNFKYSADLLATHAKNIEIGAITGVPFVEIKGTRLDGWGRIFKRAFDIVVSLLLIVLTSPIMLATALGIVLDSKGPVLFRKLDDGTPLSRIGEHGKPFPYFKFRSMKPGTDSQRYAELAHLDTRQGPLVKIKDDPRVTRVGKFIR